MSILKADKKVIYLKHHFLVQVSEDCGNGITALKGKVACTKFNRISTDGKHSIVSCRPITGRTHQVRKVSFPHQFIK